MLVIYTDVLIYNLVKVLLEHPVWFKGQMLTARVTSDACGEPQQIVATKRVQLPPNNCIVRKVIY